MYDADKDLLKIDLKDIKIQFSTHIKYLKEYIKFNEKELNKRDDLIKIWLEQDVKANPDHEHFFQSFYAKDFIILPTYFYHSTIITLYTLLESSLNDICENYINITSFPVKLPEISGSNIILKTKFFLEKFAGVGSYEMEKIWTEFRKYQKIRNLIVHQNSRIKASKDMPIEKSKEFNLLNGFKDITVDKTTGEFYITNIAILLKFIDLIEDYINEVTGILEDKSYPSYSSIFYPPYKGKYCPPELLEDLPF